MLQRTALLGLIALAACDRGAGTTAPVVEAAPLAVHTQNAPQAAVVGTPFDYDATRGGAAFSGGSGSCYWWWMDASRGWRSVCATKNSVTSWSGLAVTRR